MLRSTRRVFTSSVTASMSMRKMSTAAAASSAPPMFCYQCEQTQDNKGCTTVGVCGKEPETAALQDLQLHFNIGLGQWAHAIQSKNGTVPESVKELLLDSTFATLTNVNFDSSRFYSYLKRANAARDELCQQAKSLGVDPKSLSGPAHFKYSEDKDFLKLEATAQSVLARRAAMNNDDSALGVREMAMYGIKGTMAYFNHAERVYKSAQGTSNTPYSVAAREEVYSGLYRCLSMIAPEKPALGDMVGAALKVGEVNLKVMELLDGAHSSSFGHQEPTTVTSKMTEGKCILVSGHDIVDLYKLLQKTEGKGINVYTHGEMLPAHAYPELKKFKHLKGHYGSAWQRQKIEFAKFPGAILLTSNCLVEPLPSYEKRVFSCNSVGSSKVHHLSEFDFEPLIKCALESPGFKAADCLKKTSTAESFLIGFGHNTVLSVADKVLDAVAKGHLKNIFVIGGCDGSEGERNYFTKLGEQLPMDSVALTLGCGKFRINGHDMGTLPNVGIPRLLDFGQCNDSYGAVKVALTLANALKTDVNSLPLHFAVSWFEQKAVAVLLTLLHLNVQNIYLGPNLPAFLTPAVLDVLVSTFKIHQCNSADASADLKQMLGRLSNK